MPGVTGTGHRNLDIVRMIRLWAQSERSDGRFPADVLNFHGYSTDNQANPVSQALHCAHTQLSLYLSPCLLYAVCCMLYAVCCILYSVFCWSVAPMILSAVCT